MCVQLTSEVVVVEYATTCSRSDDRQKSTLTAVQISDVVLESGRRLESLLSYSD